MSSVSDLVINNLTTVNVIETLRQLDTFTRLLYHVIEFTYLMTSHLTTYDVRRRFQKRSEELLVQANMLRSVLHADSYNTPGWRHTETHVQRLMSAYIVSRGLLEDHVRYVEASRRVATLFH